MTTALGCCEGEIMTFDYLLTRRTVHCKGKVVRVKGSTIVTPLRAKAIRLAVEDFPSIRTLGARMRVMIIPCDAERVNA
jgi:hypothetical protein